MARKNGITQGADESLFDGLSRIAKLDVWRVLKLLEAHPRRPRRISEIINAGVKKYMLYRVVLPRLREIGAIAEGRDPSTIGDGHRRVYFAVWITEKGAKLLKDLDNIKELMKKWK